MKDASLGSWSICEMGPQVQARAKRLIICRLPGGGGGGRCTVGWEKHPQNYQVIAT